MATKKSSSAKSMDIQKPGSGAPDSSARPIVVTNRPMLQDPMVVNDKKDDAEKPSESAENKQTLATSAKTISLPKESEPKNVPKDESVDVQPPIVEAKPVDKTPEMPKADEQAEEAAKDAAVVDAVIASSRKGSESSETDKLVEADDKRKQVVETLIKEGKYIVPIGQVSRRKHKRNALVLLVFLVAGAATYFAVIQGMIEQPLDSLFNFLDNLK